MVQAFFQDKELALNEPLAVRIIISLGKNRRINDVDAFTKQILDALEESHIVTNDALVEKVLAERIRGQNKTTIDHLEISIYTRQKL
jgi:Holliday junction resolvase RusA-like endonuclease